MKKVGLFNKISKTLQAMVRNFIGQPGIDELLNQNNFTELYRKFKIFLDGEEIPKPEYSIYALTALLLDAGIKPFGEYNNVVHTNAFFGLPIEKYIVPEGVIEIQGFAFNGCFKLKEIYLPKSLEHIGSQAFYHCPNLRYFYYNGTSENLKNILNSDTFVKLSLNKDMAVFANDGGFERNGERIK